MKYKARFLDCKKVGDRRNKYHTSAFQSVVESQLIFLSGIDDN
jgi:hypothetical protein